MFLALKQIRRARSRYGLLTLVVALLLFLILVLQAFKVALVTLFVGAIQNQSAPVLVYDTDGRRSIGDSTISTDLEARVRAAAGGATVGRLAVNLVPVQRNGKVELATFIGYDRADAGGPTRLVAGRLPSATGEVAAGDDVFKVGDELTVLPGGLRLKVVGLTSRSSLFASSAFVSYDTFLSVSKAANPSAEAPRPNALALTPAPDERPAALVERLRGAGDDVDALVRDDAAGKNPGVRSVTGLFNSLLPVFAVVVPLVTAVFFAIITVQQLPALTLLVALGAPAGRLISSLLLQAAVVLGGGLGIGALGFALLIKFPVAGVELPFGGMTTVAWIVGLGLLGMASAATAAQRVRRLDPAEALGGRGVGR
jgi:putative ABC transport system permease protein